MAACQTHNHTRGRRATGKNTIPGTGKDLLLCQETARAFADLKLSGAANFSNEFQRTCQLLDLPSRDANYSVQIAN